MLDPQSPFVAIPISIQDQTSILICHGKPLVVQVSSMDLHVLEYIFEGMKPLPVALQLSGLLAVHPSATYLFLAAWDA